VHPEVASSEIIPLLHTRDVAREAASLGKLGPAEARRLLERSGFRYPRLNIVFHCLKGGAAKTTLAYNTAYRLAQLGTRVLLVDLDKQANATASFGLGRPDRVFVDVVTGDATAEQAVVRVAESLDVIPSSLDNARLEPELIHRRVNPRTYYRNLLAPVRDRYDVTIFDLPPDLSHNTYLTSLYADVICIPTTPDEYSVHGMRLTLGAVESIAREYPDARPRVLVIWTRFDPREKSALSYIAENSKLDGAEVLPIVIRTDVTFKNAQARAQSVFQLRKRSAAREDIDLLARELVGLRELSEKAGNA